MKGLRKYLWGMMVAAAAITASTQSARADLTLEFSGVGAGASYNTQGTPATLLSDGNYGLVFASSNQNQGPITGTLYLGTSSLPTGTAYSYMINYSISSVYNAATNTETVSFLNGTVITAGSNVTSGQTLNLTLSGGVYSAPAAGPAFLTATLDASFAAGQGQTNGSGQTIPSMTSQANLTGSGNTGTTAILSAGPNLVPSNVGIYQTTSTAVTLSDPYTIASVNAEVNGLLAGNTDTFTASASIALPEPSGMVAGMAGLPCMGLLLGFAHRIRNRAKAMIAA